VVLLHTPELELGRKMPDFNLLATDGEYWDMHKCMGKNGLVVMFICNHCPYVKSIQGRLVEDALSMQKFGINTAAIMSNDVNDYPEDSFENMKKIAAEFDFPFPYLIDETQQVAKAYGAVCTPDFFGYNKSLQLQYRGRLDASRKEAAAEDVTRDLFEAMKLVAKTGRGPEQQIPSMGCSIKWKAV